MKKKKKKIKKRKKKRSYTRTQKLSKKINKKKPKKKQKRRKSYKHKVKKNPKKKQKRRKSYKHKAKKKISTIAVKKGDEFLLKIIELQNSLKPNFKIKFNPLVAIDNFFQKFLQKISDIISKYKTLKGQQIKRKKVEELERIGNEKIESQKKLLAEKDLIIKLKEQMLKDEIRLEKESERYKIIFKKRTSNHSSRTGRKTKKIS